jgi:hypothetical protein
MVSIGAALRLGSPRRKATPKRPRAFRGPPRRPRTHASESTTALKERADKIDREGSLGPQSPPGFFVTASMRSCARCLFSRAGSMASAGDAWRLLELALPEGATYNARVCPALRQAMPIAKKHS